MPVSRVLIDANVVYSRTLLDWVSLLSLRSNMFEIFWTEDMTSRFWSLEQFRRSLSSRRPASR